VSGEHRRLTAQDFDVPVRQIVLRLQLDPGVLDVHFPLDQGQVHVHYFPLLGYQISKYEYEEEEKSIAINTAVQPPRSEIDYR